MKTTGHFSGFRANEAELPAALLYCPGLPPFFATGWEALSSLPGRDPAAHFGREAQEKLTRLRPVLGEALVEAAWRAAGQEWLARRERQLEEAGQVLAEAQRLGPWLQCCA